MNIDDVDLRETTELIFKILKNFRYFGITINNYEYFDKELILNCIKSIDIKDFESVFEVLLSVGLIIERIDKKDFLYTSKLWREHDCICRG